MGEASLTRAPQSAIKIVNNASSLRGRQIMKRPDRDRIAKAEGQFAKIKKRLLRRFLFESGHGGIRTHDLTDVNRAL